MPQITLECTDNIIEKDLTNVILQIHHILSKDLPTQLQSCKTRILRHQNCVVGDGDKRNAFVHLSVNVLRGRSVELLSSVGSTIIELLKSYFSLSLNELNLQITVAIQDLPEVYKKCSSTTHQ